MKIASIVKTFFSTTAPEATAGKLTEAPYRTVMARDSFKSALKTEGARKILSTDELIQLLSEAVIAAKKGHLDFSNHLFEEALKFSHSTHQDMTILNATAAIGGKYALPALTQANAHIATKYEAKKVAQGAARYLENLPFFGRDLFKRPQFNAVTAEAWARYAQLPR